jgi:putative membrane protein
MKRKPIPFEALFFWFLLAGSWFLPEPALAQNRPYYGGGPGMMGYGLMGWFYPIGMILFWILIVVVIVLLIKGVWPSKGSEQPARAAEESALDILKKRYARGEINKEEFLEKKKDLES